MSLPDPSETRAPVADGPQRTERRETVMSKLWLVAFGFT